MSKAAEVAVNAVLCAAGLTILIEALQGHRVVTILLRTSLVILAAGTLALFFLVLGRYFLTEEAEPAQKSEAEKPAATPAKAGR
jgi:hypothetical protein